MPAFCRGHWAPRSRTPGSEALPQRTPSRPPRPQPPSVPPATRGQTLRVRDHGGDGPKPPEPPSFTELAAPPRRRDLAPRARRARHRALVRRRDERSRRGAAARRAPGGADPHPLGAECAPSRRREPVDGEPRRRERGSRLRAACPGLRRRSPAPRARRTSAAPVPFRAAPGTPARPPPADRAADPVPPGDDVGSSASPPPRSGARRAIGSGAHRPDRAGVPALLSRCPPRRGRRAPAPGRSLGEGDGGGRGREERLPRARRGRPEGRAPAPLRAGPGCRGAPRRGGGSPQGPVRPRAGWEGEREWLPRGRPDRAGSGRRGVPGPISRSSPPPGEADRRVAISTARETRGVISSVPAPLRRV
jgi:hypothetical protein